MKKFFKKVGAFLRQTWVWTLLLVLFVALLVWFVGPLLAVDDYKFWERFDLPPADHQLCCS
jgi:type VI secretion system protein ImpL